MTCGWFPGYANDPYDGDWALGPLGGKGIQTQVRVSPQARAAAASL